MTRHANPRGRDPKDASLDRPILEAHTDVKLWDEEIEVVRLRPAHFQTNLEDAPIRDVELQMSISAKPNAVQNSWT